MFRSEIAAGYYSDEAAELNLQMNRTELGFQPLCEYWGGSGVNLSHVGSAINSFMHTVTIHGSEGKVRSMRIKVAKPKKINKIKGQEKERENCKLFSELVSDYCYKKGIQNIFYTYSDSVNRYFDFFFCPVSWSYGIALDMEEFIRMSYPYFIVFAGKCAYSGLEVSFI